MSSRAPSPHRIVDIARNGPLDAFSRDLELAALDAGEGEAILELLGIPYDLARSLLRSRRLRVLDWLAQSGYSLANVLPETTTRFLEIAVQHGLADAQHTVDRLHASLERVLVERDPTGWLCEVSVLETLLICARRVRGTPRRFDDHALVRLARDARWARVDPRAREAHELLPTYDVPSDDHAGSIERALASLGGHPRLPVPVLAIGGVGNDDGIVAELSDWVASFVGRLATSPMPFRVARDQLDAETLDAFLAYELLEAVVDDDD